MDKKLTLHKVDDNYLITNGPAFIDKNNFYHTDSLKRIIYKIKINIFFFLISTKNKEFSFDTHNVPSPSVH